MAKYKPINVLLPTPWIPYIDEARGDQERAPWIRDIVRDALKDLGVWPSNPKEDLDEQKKYVNICIFELGRGHGSFLTHVLNAFVRSDPANARILLPVMKALTRKYSLKEAAVVA